MNCNKCKVRLNWGVAEVLCCPKCNDIYREIINKPELLPSDDGQEEE